MNNKILLEIGIEELPAQYVKEILESYKSVSEKLFKENKVEYEMLNVYSSPRRLTLLVDGVASEQSSLSVEYKGPAKNIAFVNNEPSKSLLGFLKSKNAELSNVIYKELNGVEYVYVSQKSVSRPVIELLPTILKNIIEQIALPRSMRWSNLEFRFIRPIRWIVALYNSQIVPFSIAKISSGNISKGHRTLANNNILIEEPSVYFERMEQNFVIVDEQERKNLIINQIQKIEKENNFEVFVDESLLDEVTNLVEYPTVDVGNFDEKYLQMPNDCLITPMKDHQRYFPIFKDGKLLNKFLYVRNGDDYCIETVRKGNERVLVARLDDAEFFYKEDLKVKLIDRAEKLDSIVFRDGLGTMKDKVERINVIAQKLQKLLKLKNLDSQNLKKACILCKADLITNMVNEFEELQGVMGREYAEYEGYCSDVCYAIGEQYLPRFALDQIPETEMGAILSLSDKFDDICGSFAVNVMPTGSQDPFGLRRKCLGIISIILQKKYDVDFEVILDEILPVYAKFNKDLQVLKNELLSFIIQRVKIQLTQNNSLEAVDSVLNGNCKYKITMHKEILNNISKIKETENFDAFKENLTRIKRLIVKNDTNSEFNIELVNNSFETELYNTYKKIQQNSNNMLQTLQNYLILTNDIKNFFDNVMVMDKDEKVKNNRLALLKKVFESTLEYADLTLL